MMQSVPSAQASSGDGASTLQTNVTAAAYGAWVPRWDDMAAQIVRSLQLARGERVVYSLNPYVHPDLVEAVRVAVLRAGAIEHGVHMHWTERLSALRGARGANPDADSERREYAALHQLFAGADVFIWLPNDYLRPSSSTARITESVLGSWPGRGLHFHFFPEYGAARDDPVHERVWRTLEHAILDLDYAALRRTQQRLVDAIRGRTLHVSTPDGTDLRITLRADGWYHLNDGDASLAKVARATCARDREEELPPGSVRTLPDIDSIDGVISYRRRQGILHDDLGRFSGHLDLVFRHGRLTERRGGPLQQELDALWGRHAGGKDRLTEVVFGANPLLTPVDGARFPPYWGYGAGVFRVHLGDITESGGPVASTFAAELFMTDATVRVDGDTIIDTGRLLIE